MDRMTSKSEPQENMPVTLSLEAFCLHFSQLDAPQRMKCMHYQFFEFEWCTPKKSSWISYCHALALLDTTDLLSSAKAVKSPLVVYAVRATYLSRHTRPHLSLNSSRVTAESLEPLPAIINAVWQIARAACISGDRPIGAVLRPATQTTGLTGSRGVRGVVPNVTDGNICKLGDGASAP